jgi:putative tryptophan/tyrosine transport system substrate-binding protein
MTTELSPKRLELLHEAVPGASRVMFLHDPQAAPNAWKLTQEAAPRLGITLQQVPIRTAEELLPQLAIVAKEHPDALEQMIGHHVAQRAGLVGPRRPTDKVSATVIWT